MNLSIQGFKMLRPLAKKSGTKIRIIDKYGLPFFVRAQKRKNALWRDTIWNPADGFSLRFYLGYTYRGKSDTDK